MVSKHQAGLETNGQNGTTTVEHPTKRIKTRVKGVSTAPYPPLDLSKATNPALHLNEKKEIWIESAPIHTPGPDQVLLHVRCTGICGSDVHFWKGGGIGPITIDGDCILGHEGAGVVLQIGSSVTSLKPGDRVAIEPGVPCDECFLCQKGEYNLCEDVAFAGAYPYAGSLQRYKVHSAKFCHKIPDSMTFSQGALLEPLSVVMHGISQCGLILGKGVAIQGAGPIGLVALAAARASGAYPIVISDIEPKRLAFAKKFVPSCITYQIGPKLPAEENARAIRSIFSPMYPQGTSQAEYLAPPTVLECSGVENSICTGAYIPRRGGTLMVIGVGKSVINNLPFMHLSLAEIQVKFINRYRDTWPAGINAMVGGLLNLDMLVTHRFKLEQAAEALALAADPSKGSIKCHVEDDAEEATSLLNAILQNGSR